MVISCILVKAESENSLLWSAAANKNIILTIWQGKLGKNGNVYDCNDVQKDVFDFNDISRL